MLLVALGGCRGTLPPLRGEIEPGKDPFVIFVGGTSQAGGDLYAVPAGGGSALPITYSGVGEMRPALAPDGGAVAFIRGASLRDTSPGTVWVMNLLNGAERQLRLPKGAPRPVQVGWEQDGRSVVVRAGDGLYRVPAPPASGGAKPVAAVDRERAESAVSVILGEPAFARVIPCARRNDLCLVGDTGAPALMVRDARDAARWGPDSVAYIVGGNLLVRPLGPGHERRVLVANAPRAPRQLTVFPGTR